MQRGIHGPRRQNLLKIHIHALATRSQILRKPPENLLVAAPNSLGLRAKDPFILHPIETNQTAKRKRLFTLIEDLKRHQIVAVEFQVLQAVQNLVRIVKEIRNHNDQIS